MYHFKRSFLVKKPDRPLPLSAHEVAHKIHIYTTTDAMKGKKLIIQNPELRVLCRRIRLTETLRLAVSNYLKLYDCKAEWFEGGVICTTPWHAKTKSVVRWNPNNLDPMVSDASTPSHPGEIIRNDYIKQRRLGLTIDTSGEHPHADQRMRHYYTSNKFGITLVEVADCLHVSIHKLYNVVYGRNAVHAEMALRLAQYFGTSAKYWLDLQTAYDLSIASAKYGADIKRTITPRKM
jgi:addiction module HigA family antidote